MGYLAFFVTGEIGMEQIKIQQRLIISSQHCLWLFALKHFMKCSINMRLLTREAELNDSYAELTLAHC